MYCFLGNCLNPWFSKKQGSISLSTVETEYVIAGVYCTQLLWMKHALLNFDLLFSYMFIKCDGTNAINLSKNSIHYSRTKHIDI